MLYKKLIIVVIALFSLILFLTGVFLFIHRKASNRFNQIQNTQNVIQGNLKIKQTETRKDEANKEKTNPEIKEFDTAIFENKKSVQEASKESKELEQFKLFVRNFIEDYGSFSTNSGYNHIKNLYNSMTSNMRKFTDSWILKDPAKTKSSVFYSIETKVSSVYIGKLTDLSALVSLDTLRTETDVPEYYNKTFKQSVEVSLVKEGDDWKVAGVYWR